MRISRLNLTNRVGGGVGGGFGGFFSQGVGTNTSEEG